MERRHRACKDPAANGPTGNHPVRGASGLDSLPIVRKRQNSQPTIQPTNRAVLYDLQVFWQSPRVVSCCKTTSRYAVTAEVASSSLVVPTIFLANTLGAPKATVQCSARESSVQLDHGLTIGIERSSKCDVFRVASFA
jgi:hypothetical protein